MNKLGTAEVLVWGFGVGTFDFAALLSDRGLKLEVEKLESLKFARCSVAWV